MNPVDAKGKPTPIESTPRIWPKSPPRRVKTRPVTNQPPMPNAVTCQWHDGFDATIGYEACLNLELADAAGSQPVRRPRPRPKGYEEKSTPKERVLCHACQAPCPPTIRELKLNCTFVNLCYDHAMEKAEVASTFSLIEHTSSSSSDDMFEHL